jgi:hypothetical protein
VKKPLPASAAIGGEGRKEQHAGSETTKKSNTPRGKAAKKAPIEAKTALQERRNALERKKAAGTLSPKETQELNSLVSKLKKPS